MCVCVCGCVCVRVWVGVYVGVYEPVSDVYIFTLDRHHHLRELDIITSEHLMNGRWRLGGRLALAGQVNRCVNGG